MTIPQREPIGDVFSGVLLQYATASVLAQEKLDDTGMIAEGKFTLRYGIRYLEKPNLSIVPGLLALDYGEMLTGEAMWTFIQSRSNLHPRADVLGYRNDGKDEMVVLKKLDLAQPFEVLVYQDALATTPVGSADAVVGDLSSAVSDRFLEILPHFPSLEAWLNRE
jgi:hypothetical protein